MELIKYYNQYTTVDGAIILGGMGKIDSSIEIPVACVLSNKENNAIISVTVDRKKHLMML